MFEQMRRDIRTVLERDPAARSSLEVVLCCPGVHAIWFHRLAHPVWRRGWHTLARFISHVGRVMPGVEIHPAAAPGPGPVLDHGMGVLSGEPPGGGQHV